MTERVEPIRGIEAYAKQIRRSQIGAAAREALNRPQHPSITVTETLARRLNIGATTGIQAEVKK